MASKRFAITSVLVRQCSRVIVDNVGRVLRGGAWNNNARRARSANRNRNEPDNRNNNIGFRLALARIV